MAEVITSPAQVAYRPENEKKETGFPKDEKKDPYVSDEKKEVATVNVSVKKDPYLLPKSPGKPKKKVSKWILWQLWFDTYRCVSRTLITLIMNYSHLSKINAGNSSQSRSRSTSSGLDLLLQEIGLMRPGILVPLR